MINGNHTTFSGFTLLGFSKQLELQVLYFALFLTLYAAIITGNGLIIYVTSTDPTLDIPMYYFLKSLSFLEICYTSVTAPKMMADLMEERAEISFLGCAIQNFFLLSLGSTECLLLAAMAYDRYVAICNPLHYKLIMTQPFCQRIVILFLSASMVIHGGQVYLAFSLSFCGSHEISNLFCDIPPLLKLACGDTHVNKSVMFTAAVVFLFIPFSLILASYAKIFSVVLKVPSAESQKKAFATCSSHLCVVFLFYGSAIVVYVIPKSKELDDLNKLLTLFYIIIVPMFNPIIYTLRNREVKSSFKKLFRRKT